jgi:transcriptional regulator with XRE-family HTH domain
MPRPPRRPPSGDGAWLRQTRERLGLTQAALGEAIGLHPNTVARIERGELPLERVTRLAVEHLGCRPR